MNPQIRFRCALIGTGSVLIQCADELLRRGHSVVAVASPDPRVATWAHAASIPFASDFAGLISLTPQAPDLLWSIVNNDVLPSTALTWPTHLAINYHDGPLPRYAGIHATSWAILAGETEHAVSWHVMTDRVDFGDILASEPFPISAADSAFTLNAKAYEAALRSFRTLLTQLESQTHSRAPQSESQRTWFGRHHRPPHAGILDWTASATDLLRLVRALDFGPYDNRLGTARIWTGSRFLFATNAAPTDTGPNSAPGTIISVADASLRVSTGGSSDIRLLGLREIDGSPANLAEPRFACARQLPPLDPAELQRIIALDSAAHRTENWWINRLANVQPIQTPFISSLQSLHPDPSAETSTLDIATPLGSTAAQQIAAFAIYLARVSRNTRFDLPLHTPAQPNPLAPAGQLFETHPPMRVDLNLETSFQSIQHAITAELETLAKHPTYARDLLARSTRLRDIAELRSTHLWHAAIELTPHASSRAAITLLPSDTGCSLRFRTDAVPTDQAIDIAAQFQQLLAQASAAPHELGSRLSILTPAERRRVLETFAGPTRNYERGITLADLIARMVAQHPDAPAVIFNDTITTYAQLDALSNRIAHRLIAQGVKPGSLVGVCLERSTELVATLVAVIKSGGAYVPLDPSYPIERLKNMIEDAHLAVLVTSQNSPSSHSTTPLYKSLDWQGQTLFVDDPSLAANPAHTPTCPATEHDPAYVIFTSGSTGKPKGAANAHVAIINRLMWMQEHYQLTPTDRVLQKTPYSFDVSVWEFFWPLITGATIVVAKPEGHRDSAYLVDLIAHHAVTVLHFVPSMLRVFIEERNVTSCTTIRRVVCSGEALPFDLVERFFSRLPNAHLANLYGPTEAAVDVTAWECHPNDPRGIVPIGSAVPNTFMYALDDHLTPTPTGVPGELFIGGIQVGMGYVNRPELTADRFIQNPFRPGEKMYKTGDLGRFLPDASIEYLGRLDDQVKIRGFRIELGEIEFVLSAQPDVQEAVVLAREDVPGTKRLVAYIVGSATHSALRDALAKLLPEYMVPAAFVTLDALPVTANGKLDRRALPAPPRGSAFASDRPFVAPTSDTEAQLAQIWAQVLNLPRVSIDDNFFEIGGDSILALRIVAKASDADIHIAVHDLFRAPTVRALASTAATAQSTATTRTQPFQLISANDRAKLPPDIIDAYPLSALQSGMVFHSERAIGSYLYQVAMSLHVRARLDLTLLQRAVDQVVARNPILRTSFDLGTFAEPMQLVHAAASAPIEYHDISHLPSESQQALLARWIDDEAEYEFDWSRPPLLKYTVHKRSPDTFQFGITFHDAILDGWSTSNMMTEIFSRYVNMLAGAPDLDLTPNPITYRDFVALERTTLNSHDAQTFWAGLMDDAPFTQVPRIPGVGADVPVARNLDLIVPIPADVNQRVIERARELAIPLKSFYLAAHTRVLGMLAHQDDVVTGLVMNGRIEDPGGDSSLGNHLNTMPYRLHVADQTWFELAQSAHHAELAALPHRRYIGAQLLRDLGRAGQDNLFETGFNYTHFHVYDRLAGRDDIEFLRVDFTDPFHYVLVANFRVDAYDKRLDVVLNYNNKHMTRDQVKQIGRYYLAALRAIAADPHQPASPAAMLPKSEKRQLLDDFAGPARPYPQNLTLDQLIAQQAAATPHAPAVIFSDQTTTYAQLDANANRIAHRLLALGVKPHSLVGVCLQRSTELVAALLGVMRAGAAYVPLDPTYPPERLANMIDDAALAAFITSASDPTLPSSSAQLATLNWQGPTLFLDDPSLATSPSTPPASTATPDDPAYAIFTSGSTGRPKAALNAHRAIINRLLWMQDEYQLTPSDRVLQKTPFSFDVSVWEFFWPLITGAAIVVAKPEGHRDTAYLAHIIQHHNVSVMHFVPSMLRAFLEEPTLPRITSLRRVVCSGEALPFDLVQRFFTILPAVRLANLYGPTEAAVDVTAWECAPRDPRNIIPIGFPIANTHLLVLDPRLELAPIGTPGELYIGGIQVGIGYVNRPELTAERFIQHPFRPAEKLYKTGDLARFLNDGSIEYLGRLDDQVKIRGFRIELGEIQHAIAHQPNVQHAVVIAREDIPASPRIVAYIVGSADHATLRAALARTLPEYMVPAAFVTLDSLPVTSNGKLDRRALPAPSRAAASAADRSAAEHATDLESTLAAVWAQVLRLDSVALNDNFFEIGGDSILSIQICARARRHGILITPNQLFDHPTIALLAPHARQAAALTAHQGPVTGHSPLIPIQQWLLDQNLAQPSHWNAAIMLEVPSRIDDLTFRRALLAVVNHHDALRLRYQRNDQTWTQHFDTPDATNLAFHTALVDQFSTPAADASVERHGTTLQTGFNLAQGPLFGAVLFRERNGGSARLLMAAHHLVLDGFSWRLIIEDLMLACEHISQGQSPSLPQKTHSLRDWAHALEQHTPSISASPQQREWWMRELAASPQIPLDHPAADNTEASAIVHTTIIDPAATRALLHDVPASYHAQINDILLAALGITLRQWVSRDTLRIDMMGHGREAISDDLDVSRTVGWFTTLFPVALPLHTMTNPASAINAAREHLRQIPARGIGFGLARSWDTTDLGSAIRQAAPAALSFNYLGQFDQSLSQGWSLRIARTSCGPTRHPSNTRPAIIEVDAMIVDDVLRIDWIASSALHNESTIQSLAANFSTAIAHIIRDAAAASNTAPAAASAFPLAGLDDEGLARLSALFDASEFTDE
ncbi:MAG: amino acid adenylation domain-containing protein [Phycisphaeraceae bacterium]|nr:amino acid adenylation domain-containing protein [Phycisphaeraceae bacterium]